VLFSLVYRLIRSLLGSLALLVRSDVPKDVELLVLRQENQVLRRQVHGPLRWDQADRLWISAPAWNVTAHTPVDRRRARTPGVRRLRSKISASASHGELDPMPNLHVI
jgi:hypothetical protein